MRVNNNGYNVPFIYIDEILSDGTATNVNFSNKQYLKIANMANKSGTLRISFNDGDARKEKSFYLAHAGSYLVADTTFERVSGSDIYYYIVINNSNKTIMVQKRSMTSS